MDEPSYLLCLQEDYKLNNQCFGCSYDLRENKYNIPSFVCLLTKFPESVEKDSSDTSIEISKKPVRKLVVKGRKRSCLNLDAIAINNLRGAPISIQDLYRRK